MTGALTLSADPATALQASTKQYVDNAITAVNPATSVLAASTGALTVSYNNGVSGVGAFLTNAGAQAAFSLDGQSPTIGQRVLIKDQSTTYQNGVYTVTVIGTGLTNWVLTRALDYDQPSDINNTGVINILSGTVNALTGWLINSSVTNIGADAITYTKYNNAPSSITQYDVLVGGANNLIASVGPGSSGQALLSGGNAANPAYSTATYPSTAGTSGNLLTSDGTNWNSTAPSPTTGRVIQQVRTTSSTATSTSTNLATTGTVPTTSNTTQLITLICTPTSASNILYFQFSAPFTTSSSNVVAGFFLFAGSTLISSFPFFGSSSSTAATANFDFYAAAGTTSTTTYAVYYAANTATLDILKNNSGTAFYGGSASTNIIFSITEQTP